MNFQPSIETILPFFSKEFSELLMRVDVLHPNWKWFVLIGMSAFWFLLFPALTFIMKSIKGPLLKRIAKEGTFLNFYLNLNTERALSGVISTTFLLLTLDALKFGGQTEKYLHSIFVVVTFWFIIRLLYLAADAIGQVFTGYAAKSESKMDDMLAPFLTKSLKVVIVVFGFLLLLQGLGLNVVSLLAGLGLGGLALALAAQDTAANIFGSITIFLDQPFTIGDYVNIQGVEGTVESIGFRSTQLRTPYNSLISIPNSVVAKERIDNLGARPRRRIRHSLGISYSTTPEQLEEFCNNLRYVIKQEPKVDPESITVAFNGYGESSLNILVNFHLFVDNLEQELQIQHKVLLDFLALANQMRVDYAFPTRTIYINQQTKDN